jgi:hypothetical protein
MAQPEAQISKKIIGWLNKQPHTLARKRHVSGYGVRGDPDITGCTYGRHFEIEVKTPGKTSTENQQSQQRKWRDAYSSVTEVYSLDDAKEFYFAILATIPEREK